MSIHIECEVTLSWDFSIIETAQRVVKAALEQERCPYETEINLLITDSLSIQEINRSHRGIDASTDVLSFPVSEFLEAGEFSHLEEEKFDFNPETGEWMAGDIILSADKIEEQAAAYGHSIEREFGFLIAHSMLHLFGYDHLQQEECTVMEEKQRSIMDQIGLKR